MAPNSVHELRPKKPMFFNSLMELPGVIEKVLIQHGITIHPSPRMRQYLSTKE